MEGGGLERSTYPKLHAIESEKWEKRKGTVSRLISGPF